VVAHGELQLIGRQVRPVDQRAGGRRSDVMLEGVCS